jgi:cytoskeletal protein RodZ
MQESKTSSNIISIVVAIISIALILFAVFLLNQTFNGNRNTTVSATSSSVSSSRSVSSQSRTSLATVIATSSDAQFNSTNQSPASSSSSRSTSSSSSSNQSTQQNNSSSSTANSGNYSLQSGEFVAKYVSGSERNFEMVECNIPNPVYCKAGLKFTYNSSGDKTNGSLYKFTGGEISDTQESLSISNFVLTKVS